MKALLQELGHAIPHTHILRDLLNRLVPHHGELRSLHRGVKFLTRFAVETRYPGESATKRQAAAALRGEALESAAPGQVSKSAKL